VTRQDVFHFGNDASLEVPARARLGRIRHGRVRTGDVDGYGVKVAPDLEGPSFDPEHDQRVVSAENEEAARACTSRRGSGPVRRAGRRDASLSVTP
jgi:hypothetical protein